MSSSSTIPAARTETEEAARALQAEFAPLEVRTRQELEQAFRSIGKSGSQAVIIGGGGFFYEGDGKRILRSTYDDGSLSMEVVPARK